MNDFEICNIFYINPCFCSWAFLWCFIFDVVKISVFACCVSSTINYFCCTCILFSSTYLISLFLLGFGKSAESVVILFKLSLVSVSFKMLWFTSEWLSLCDSCSLLIVGFSFDFAFGFISCTDAIVTSMAGGVVLQVQWCCWNHLLQRLKFASAVRKCQGFCRGISMFFSIYLSKKKCWSNWIHRNLKKLLFQQQEMSCLIKKVSFIFYTIFKLLRCRSFPVLNADVCLLVSYFCCSCILVSKTWDIKRMLTLLCQYKWQKFNKMNEKRSLGYQCGCWICNWANY